MDAKHTPAFCKCGSCMTHPDERNPREKFIAEVHDNGGFWSAEAQGKLAALSLEPRYSPFHGPHVYQDDWYRGYDAALAKEQS